MSRHFATSLSVSGKRNNMGESPIVPDFTDLFPEAHVTKQFIVEFIDTEGKHRARRVDIDETASPDARDRSIKTQVESRTMRVSRIRACYRVPDGMRGKP